MKIAMFGGTFDPFHHGHSAVLEATIEELGIERAYVAPVQLPPHKKANNVSAFHHRFAMTALAVAHNSKVVPVKLGDSSYAVDEVATLKAMHPDDSIYYIMGLDSFLDLHHWHQADKLAEMCHFVVSRRPGYNDDLLRRATYFKPGRVSLINQVYIDISATEIRNSINGWQWMAKQLVRPSVYEYIQKTGIYQINKQTEAASK